MLTRYLRAAVSADLKEKMVFIGGPRQVGKTTFALDLLLTLFSSPPPTSPPKSLLNLNIEKIPAYLNWDARIAKRLILRGELPAKENFIVFDEIHKYKHWRNTLKGYYDLYQNSKKFLVTGSARLDFYRRGGDSLQGRYHYYRMHPLSLDEISPSPNKSDLAQLLQFGGYPEPCLRAQDRHWRRWQKEHTSRVFQEDIAGLEQIKEISQMELLATILPERVGSILSVNSIREDLSVAFETADRWITILENIYYCYRIPPLVTNKIRAARKEKKLYMWDWSLVENKGAKFENLVASHLAKYCHFLEDTLGDSMQLCFLRDSEKREIDFIVVKNKKPIFGVECKTGEKSVSTNIEYFFRKKLIPRFYQVHLGSRFFENAALNTLVVPFEKFANLLCPWNESADLVRQ